ncbi:hypothetical protein E1267_01065 [Nonomuraea longispora]|uniref:Uncharacterized protein n=1 Tax=Nonomuraea longispora TaxID=1848320 RepID=A0A4R4NP48_9ACTN|nr:hypothetical protein [Nonomuraea longispora]TDC11288.1 hypothetical protein E1267_01065 [Nonomuraea longispora]
MDESGRSGRRRAAGRHAAAHARSRHAWSRPGHRAVRRRGLRHRRRTHRRGLLAGAITLGAAALLAVNQAFGGALTAISAGPSTAADGPTPPSTRTTVERGSGSSPGRSGAGASATAEAGARVTSREVRTPARPRATGAAGREAGAASPEAAEPGLVAGTGDPDVAGADVAGDPETGDTAGHRADGPSRHTDREAAEFFRTRWGADDKALKRLKDIRMVGGYLRIYTDLPESAGNSATALTLCERGLAYLRARGVDRPVVFVQAEFGENGNPVLANILGPSDTSCRITYPAPG